jgi:Uma2 family endonuclease
VSMREPKARPRRVQYPDSDGKPMGETDLHRVLMTDLIFALQNHLRERGVQAYVAGNLFLYYEEGNPRAVVAPDVMVIPGAAQFNRRTFQTWREGGLLPAVIIELTSRSTAKEDRELKPALYARLGVQEYFLFDPYSEYLNPPLQGYRLDGESYQPMLRVPLRSQLLGLDLRQDDSTLRFYEPRTGTRLLTPAETVIERAKAEKMARAAVIAARRAEQERAQAEQERAQAEERAAALEQRAAALEAELARVRAERDQPRS